MIDVVIDTCTLVHANNPDSQFNLSSIALINKMLSISIKVVVDDGFDLDEAKNQSHIAREYIENLIPGMLGYTFLQQLASNKRFSYVPNRIDNASKKKLEKIIVNKVDRHFLRVANNSKQKNFISHDFYDFQKKKRSHIRKEFGITIYTADEFNPFL